MGKTLRRGRILLATLLGVLALGVGAARAAQTTLAGEDLFAPVTSFSATSSCNTAATSTVSWTVQGVASGPYPGTFTATGTMTIGPQTLPGNHPPGPNREGTVAGPIHSFQESFTIQSGLTTVTGTKTLDPLAPNPSLGTCQQVTQFPVLDFFDGHGTVFEADAYTRYQAQIHAATSSASDSGTALASLSELDITGSCLAGPACQAKIGGFDQTFTLSDRPTCIDESVVEQRGQSQLQEACEAGANN